MINASVCPDITQFKKLAIGQLASPDKETLLDHLEGCHACVQRLESLSENDTLVDLIRQARTVGEGPAGETVAGLIEHLRELRPSVEAAVKAPAQIRLVCSGCGKSLKVKAPLVGKKVKCPGCQAVLPVPNAKPKDASAPPRPEVGEAMTLAPTHSFDGNSAGTATDAGAVQPQPTGTDQNLCDFLAPAQSPDELGRLGMYRVLKVLGAGGMGVVFKAEDPGLKRLVAIKAMLPAIAASASAKIRFLREAQAAAAIKHIHIVTIHQVGEDRGVPFLAMEFLEGEPLDDRLKRETTLPLAETLRIGREMAEGLAAAHARGLIHRDIKPANTWLEASPGRKSGEFCVKILDFGLARSTDDQAHLTQSGAIIGTPAYMAPEQGRGGKLDARCDLWSLGVVLYRMCTGEVPFKGTDTVGTLMEVAMTNPPPPKQINAAVPAGLSDLIMKLLEKDPVRRIASAQEVAEALRWLEQSQQQTQAIEAHHARSGLPQRKPAAKEKAKAVKPQPAARGRRDLPWITIGGALAAVFALLAVGIVLFWPTPHGVIRIESDDPGVKVVFDKDGATIKGVDKETIRLMPGNHGVVVKRGDFEFVTDNFTMSKGERITLKIELLQGKMQFLRNDQVIGEKNFPPVDPWLAKNDPAKKTGKTAEALPSKYKNSLGMEFVLVPKGKFLMGGGAGTVGATEVSITNDFYLGKYEVTQGEWEAVTGVNPSYFRREGGGRNEVVNASNEELKRYPVETVSWDEAQLFVQELNKREKEAGWLYRLPTEPEREYACRGGPAPNPFDYAFDFYFDKPSNQLLPEEANFVHGQGLKRTCKVGSYKPNRLGLYDMHGNVHEWCDDAIDAKDPQKAALRVSRGGSWGHESGRCRAASHDVNVASFRNQFLGLRLARVRVGTEPVASKPPEEKKTETPPLEPQLASIVQTLQGPYAEVRAVALSGDGKHALTGRTDKTAILWDVDSGKKIQTFEGHTDVVWSVALSADARFVLTGSHDKRAILWEAASAKKIQTFLGHTDKVVSVALSGDAKHVLTGSNDNTAILWDAASAKKIQTFEGHASVVNSVALSADAKRVLTGSNDNTAILWDAASAKKLQTFGHGNVVAVAMSGDGKFILTGGGGDSAAILWDAASGTKLQTFLGHASVVQSVTLSADAKHVLTGSWDYTAGLWEVASGKKLYTFQGHTNWVTSVAWTDDGKHVLTGSLDTKAILWEVKAAPPPPAHWTVPMVQKFKGHTAPVTSVALSGDGRRALTGSADSTAILWDVASGTKLQTFRGHTFEVHAVALSRDGKRVLTGSFDKTAILWEADSGYKLQTFRGHTEFVIGVALSGDGERVLTGAFDKTAILWDAATGSKLQTFQGHTQVVLGVALSGDGKHVFTGSLDSTVGLWDAASGKKIQTFQANAHVWSVALSGDGKLTGSADSTAILWDVASGTKLQTYLGHSGFVRGVALSGDAKRVVTGSWDKTAILWDAATGNKLQTFQGHTHVVNAVALSSDGKYVLTGSFDNTAILWEVKAAPATATGK